MNTQQLCYVITHLTNDDDLPALCEYLYQIDFTLLSPDEQLAYTKRIVAEIQEDLLPEDKIQLSISLAYHIPFHEVGQLPGSVGRYLLQNLKTKKTQPSVTNFASLLQKAKAGQKAAVYPAPDEEIDKIFEAQFGGMIHE
jgi:hypothetical protein